MQFYKTSDCYMSVSFRLQNLYRLPLNNKTYLTAFYV
jgi:hypothetical protein